MANDLISRQAAKSKKVYSKERHEYVIPVAEIDWLPAIDPVKHGKWIGRGDDACECSECHAVIEGDEVYWRYNWFCYHCGARMDKGDDE